MNEIESLFKLIVGLQWVIIIAFITQFISNLTIITQLPKIKKLCEEICYEEEEEEKDEIQNS